MQSRKSLKSGKESIQQTFWRYTLPATLGMLINSIYSTVDGIFLGQVVGTEGLAAINMVWPVFGTLVGVGLMCGVGAGAQFSIAKGESRSNHARQILGNSIILLTALSILAGVLLYNYKLPLMEWLGQQAMH